MDTQGLAQVQHASGLQPPNRPPRVALGFAGDEIENLGERIASLTMRQCVELTEYLKDREAGKP